MLEDRSTHCKGEATHAAMPELLAGEPVGGCVAGYACYPPAMSRHTGIPSKRGSGAARGNARGTISADRRDTVSRIAADVVDCERCPRLRRYCLEIARTRRRAFQDQEYWGRPVPGFGDARARLWILGLAPAAHGANRTGRVFTGDSSGSWLFAALHASGFAAIPTSEARNDGQRLRDAYISAAVRCAPPGNRPQPVEIDRCGTFLVRELAALPRARLLLCLGQIAFTTAVRLLLCSGYEFVGPRPRFAHGAELTARAGRGARGPKELRLLASYHPSRQNTNTGKLTQPMWTAIFQRAREILDTDADVSGIGRGRKVRQKQPTPRT